MASSFSSPSSPDLALSNPESPMNLLYNSSPNEDPFGDLSELSDLDIGRGPSFLQRLQQGTTEHPELETMQVMDSSGPVPTSPITGTKAQRKASEFRKASVKRKETISLRKPISPFNNVYEAFESPSKPFSTFLRHAFTSDEISATQFREHHLLEDKDTISKLLDHLTSNESPEAVRNAAQDWAQRNVALRVREEAEAVTKSSWLQVADLTEDAIKSFDIVSMYTRLKLSMAPVAIQSWRHLRHRRGESLEDLAKLGVRRSKR